MFMNSAFTVPEGDIKRCVEPLGIMYLANVVRREKGVDVAILDSQVEGYDNDKIGEDGLNTYGLSDDDIARRVNDFHPDVVGISSLFSSQFPNAVHLANVVKQINPDIVVVLGGPHPTALPEQTLRIAPSVDYVIRGEGEYPMLGLIDHLRGDIPLDKVDSLTFRKSNGDVIVNPKAKVVEPLEWIGFPARDLIDVERYIRINRRHAPYVKGNRVSPIITSRGCPAQCTFCSTQRVQDMEWINSGRTGTTEQEMRGLEESVTSEQDRLRAAFAGGTGTYAGNMQIREIRGNYRARSPDDVLREILFLREKHGVDEIQFEDDNLTSNKPAAQKLFAAMQAHGLKIHFCTPNGIAAWTLYNGGDDKNGYPLVKTMANVGCYQLSLAIESGDNYVLSRIIKKPVNLEKIPPLVGAIRDAGIWAHAFFILGFPDETLEQMNRTVDYSISLGLDSQSYSIATPLPGAPLWNECQNRGLIPNEITDSNWYRNLLFRTPIIRSPNWTHEQLLEVQGRGYAAKKMHSKAEEVHGVYAKAADRFGGQEKLEEALRRRNA